MKCSALLLLMFAAGYVSGGVVESNQDKPASYFRLYNDKVKLLPLSDKGLSASAIKPRAAGFKLGRTAPQPVFMLKQIQNWKAVSSIKLFRLSWQRSSELTGTHLCVLDSRFRRAHYLT